MKTFDLGAVTAYAIAVKHGFKGTEAEWIAHLEACAKQYEDGAKVAEANAKTSETAAAKSAVEAKQAAASAKGIAVTAQPGQLIRVKEVDENGNPTAWEAVPWGWVEGGMVEILPECQPTYYESDNSFIITQTIEGVEIGEKYIVNWNGTDYECLASEMDFDGGIWVTLGNSMVAGGEDTGEPFLMMIVPDAMRADFGAAALIMPFDGTTVLTISIMCNGEVVHKLDNKFLDLEWLPIMVGNEVVLYDGSREVPSSGMKTNFLAEHSVGVGKPYTVVYNGETYDCVGRTATGTVGGNQRAFDYFGNASLSSFIGGEDTGEPFLWEKDDTGYVLFYTPNDKNNTITLKISTIESVPNKLPSEFMPESVDGIVIRSSTADSTKKFKLTVDDSGTITATEV